MHTTSYWLTLNDAGDRFRFQSASDRAAVRAATCDGIRGSVVAVVRRRDWHRDWRTAAGVGKGSENWPVTLEGAMDRTAKESLRRIDLYDAYRGESGFLALFRAHKNANQQRDKLIAGCGCESGCPSVLAGWELAPLAKEAALASWTGRV